MKFTKIYSASNSKAALGEISDLKRHPDKKFTTPLAFAYTKGGSIPHLTHEVLGLAFNECPPIVMPVENITFAYEAVKIHNKGMASFAGLSESISWCSQTDHAVNLPITFNQKDKIALWTRFGKKLVDADLYMDMVEAFKPDFYTVLCDNATNTSSSNKKTRKSVDVSETLLKKCLERHNNSMELKSSAVFAGVQGGYNVHDRSRCIEIVSKADVDGFVIDGLFTNGLEVENLAFEVIEPIIKMTVDQLPKDKMKACYGAWNPDVLLKLVDSGIDLFDTSLAFLSTERGCALNFNYERFDGRLEEVQKSVPVTLVSADVDLPSDESLLSNDPSNKEDILVNGDWCVINTTPDGHAVFCDKLVNGDLHSKAPLSNGSNLANGVSEMSNSNHEGKPLRHNVSNDSDAKRLKTIISETKVKQQVPKYYPYEISLHDSRYKDAFVAIDSQCSCLTCQKHTRAYIHHLLNTKELLGSVLLMIHNLHHFLRFFENIRYNIKHCGKAYL